MTVRNSSNQARDIALSPSSAVGEPNGDLKVLHVINSLGAGGAELSLAELLPIYASKGIRSTVVCLKRQDEGVQAQVEENFFDLRYLSGNRFRDWLPKLRALMRSEGVNLVHTTLFESDLAGRLAAVGMSIPVVTSIVNTSYDPIRLSDPNVTRFGLWAAKSIDGWTGRHLTFHFHAISRAVKDAAVRSLRVRPDRVTVIERGRDPHRLGQPGAERRRNAKRVLGFMETDELIVTVGRQEFQKGQRYLLEAMGRLAANRPNLKLLLAGRAGRESEELHRIAIRLAIQDRVRFLGYRNDVPEILAAADLFVFPSVYEGLGGALIEAMGLGLPIVASDLPAIREVVEEGHNAYLVPPESPADLAATIVKLLDHPQQAAAFSRRSREIFDERFTLERSARRMVGLYREIIASYRHSPPR